jgi:hypothetical protein
MFDHDQTHAPLHFNPERRRRPTMVATSDCRTREHTCRDSMPGGAWCWSAAISTFTSTPRRHGHISLGSHGAVLACESETGGDVGGCCSPLDWPRRGRGGYVCRVAGWFVHGEQALASGRLPKSATNKAGKIRTPPPPLVSS